MPDPEELGLEHSEQCAVLIVDDEVIVRNYLRRVLESEGYLILTADNGEEALLLATRYEGPIHLLLSDIRMPVVNGLELKRRIIEHRPAIKIILMSAEMPSPVDVPFLQKPFSPKELKQIIVNALHDPEPPCSTVV